MTLLDLLLEWRNSKPKGGSMNSTSYDDGLSNGYQVGFEDCFQEIIKIIKLYEI